MNMKKMKTDEIYEVIKKLHYKLRRDMKEKWDRVIPFEELLFDRWEKAEFVNAGEGTSIYHMCYIYGDVEIGKNTWIGPFTLLDGTGGLKIGDYCSISAGVQIYTHDTVKWALSGGKHKYEYAPVKIGNCCFIGAGTIILKGVRIGNHCLVAANSLVNKSFGDNSIIAGVPAKKIGEVEVKDGEVILKYYSKK